MNESICSFRNTDRLDLDIIEFNLNFHHVSVIPLLTSGESEPELCINFHMYVYSVSICKAVASIVGN